LGINYVTFNSGDRCKTVQVPVKNDGVYNSPDKYFWVKLTGLEPSNPSLARLGMCNTNVNVTILEASQPPTVSFHGSDCSVSESGGVAKLDVRLSHMAGHEVAVYYHTIDGTAVDGNNYTGASSGTASIPAGTLTGTIEIPVMDNDDVGPDTTFQVQLDGASMGSTIVTPDSSTVTILEDDVPYTLYGYASFNSTGVNGAPVTVACGSSTWPLITTDGPEGPGYYELYLENSGLYPGGTISAVIEGHSVAGSFAAPARDVLSTAYRVREDLTYVPPTIGFEAAGATVLEGASPVFVRVVRYGSTDVVSKVNVTLSASHPAKQDADYRAVPSLPCELAFAVGETEKLITVSMVDDWTGEPDETAEFWLTDVSGANLTAETRYTLSIIDDDMPALPDSIPMVVPDAFIVTGQMATATPAPTAVPTIAPAPTQTATPAPTSMPTSLPLPSPTAEQTVPNPAWLPVLVLISVGCMAALFVFLFRK
jgi:hypothetical protein